MGTPPVDVLERCLAAHMGFEPHGWCTVEPQHTIVFIDFSTYGTERTMDV